MHNSLSLSILIWTIWTGLHGKLSHTVWYSTYEKLCIRSPLCRVYASNFVVVSRLPGCKNRHALFPGRMSYRATKPGFLCPLS